MIPAIPSIHRFWVPVGPRCMAIRPRTANRYNGALFGCLFYRAPTFLVPYCTQTSRVHLCAPALCAVVLYRFGGRTGGLRQRVRRLDFAVHCFVCGGALVWGAASRAGSGQIYIEMTRRCIAGPRNRAALLVRIVRRHACNDGACLAAFVVQ